MAHAVGKDGDGKYWFRSRQKLVDVTKAEQFCVKKRLKKRAYWPWRKNKYEWDVLAKFLKTTGFYRYPNIKKEWVNTTHKGPKEYTYELLGTYTDEDDAAIALECLMHMRDVELIMF